VTPPFPLYREMPKLFDELSQRYDNREVVVYAIINSEGRFEQLAMKESPRVELNAPILQASRNGPSAPRKSAANLWLLGITAGTVSQLEGVCYNFRPIPPVKKVRYIPVSIMSSPRNALGNYS
jgi:hypothetical protein